MTPQFLTINETAQRLGVTRKTVDRYLSSGKLTTHRSERNGRRYIDPREVAALETPKTEFEVQLESNRDCEELPFPDWFLTDLSRIFSSIARGAYFEEVTKLVENSGLEDADDLPAGTQESIDDATGTTVSRILETLSNPELYRRLKAKYEECDSFGYSPAFDEDDFK